MEPMRFDGQVAVVTGAGRGLGNAYARLLAERGARVVVNNRIRPGTEAQRPIADEVAEAITRAGGLAVADTSDVGTTEGAQAVVEAALATYGRLDIVVNNAGVVQFHSFPDYPDDEFERMVDVHLRGTWHVNRAAWPHLAAQGYGRIVNTVSRGAFFGDPRGAAYASCKGAILGMTRALAVEGGQAGIAVNAISPTAWTPLYASAPDVSPERRAELERDFRTEQVAPVLVLLAHSSCDFTGEVIAAAGSQVSRFFLGQTAGASLGAEPTPEDVARALPDVWDETGYHPVGLVTPGQRARKTPRAEVPPSARRSRAAGGGEAGLRAVGEQAE
ncbi:SDR family NAD(P)-dependent oxidoreductase [Amycolatopsis echigonensis]|uniref:SDR family NAD(P)-dependent oxidoreductase n=1 Tax=Amycolatopsis echigonensis TaxID=2576905 RepID=A0A8E1W5A4_9PSEU|nr:SDR family NAD(P)-dependent oxidoreductase [Amycolatopsis echigonensis]MBB2504430.1 SDR family NAD(P)-dependent oxidoreductase [Amycolatopsis echigonensis]